MREALTKRTQSAYHETGVVTIANARAMLRPPFSSRIVALLILTVVGNLFAQTNGPRSMAGLCSRNPRVGRG